MHAAWGYAIVSASIDLGIPWYWPAIGLAVGLGWWEWSNYRDGQSKLKTVSDLLAWAFGAGLAWEVGL